MIAKSLLLSFLFATGYFTAETTRNTASFVAMSLASSDAMVTHYVSAEL